MTQLMVQPSHFMSSGIILRQFGDMYLFRFTDELQSRLENLLEKKKSGFVNGRRTNRISWNF